MRFSVAFLSAAALAASVQAQHASASSHNDIVAAVVSNFQGNLGAPVSAFQAVASQAAPLVSGLASEGQAGASAVLSAGAGAASQIASAGVSALSAAPSAAASAAAALSGDASGSVSGSTSGNVTTTGQGAGTGSLVGSLGTNGSGGTVDGSDGNASGGLTTTEGNAKRGLDELTGLLSQFPNLAGEATAAAAAPSASASGSTSASSDGGIASLLSGSSSLKEKREVSDALSRLSRKDLGDILSGVSSDVFTKEDKKRDLGDILGGVSGDVSAKEEKRDANIASLLSGAASLKEKREVSEALSRLSKKDLGDILGGVNSDVFVKDNQKRDLLSSLTGDSSSSSSVLSGITGDSSSSSSNSLSGLLSIRSVDKSTKKQRDISELIDLVEETIPGASTYLADSGVSSLVASASSAAATGGLHAVVDVGRKVKRGSTNESDDESSAASVRVGLAGLVSVVVVALTML